MCIGEANALIFGSKENVRFLLCRFLSGVITIAIAVNGLSVREGLKFFKLIFHKTQMFSCIG